MCCLKVYIKLPRVGVNHHWKPKKVILNVFKSFKAQNVPFADNSIWRQLAGFSAFPDLVSKWGEMSGRRGGQGRPNAPGPAEWPSWKAPCLLEALGGKGLGFQHHHLGSAQKAPAAVYPHMQSPLLDSYVLPVWATAALDIETSPHCQTRQTQTNQPQTSHTFSLCKNALFTLWCDYNTFNVNCRWVLGWQ